MTTTTKWILALVVLAVLVAIIFFRDKISSLYNELTKAQERISDATKNPDPVVVVPVVPVTPRPNTPTCDQIKAQIGYYTALSAKYPMDQRIKATLQQLKERYASLNCEGGPRPDAEAAQ